MNKISLIAISVLLLLSGCAQKASKIKASYVSPLKYEKYFCINIKDEIIRVNRRLTIISGEQNKQSNNDVVTMAVGLTLFPPVLFMFAVGEDQEIEIAKLKGDYNVLRDVAHHKNCKFASQMR